MQQSTPENALSWRDLSDGLMPAQMTELENKERTGCSPDALRYQARTYLEAALGEVLLGDIEAPADAINVYPWEMGDSASGVWHRHFRGTRRKAGALHVDICGVQEEDGTADREVNVWGRDEHYLTSAETRELAAALIASADELECRGDAMTPEQRRELERLCC